MVDGNRISDIGHAVQPWPRQPASGWCGSTPATPSAPPCTRAPGAQLGSPGKGPKLASRQRLRHRAHGQPRQPARRGCWTTAGAWSPPTAASRPTSSTPSPSPTTAPRSSPSPTCSASGSLAIRAGRRRPGDPLVGQPRAGWQGFGLWTALLAFVARRPRVVAPASASGAQPTDAPSPNDRPFPCYLILNFLI